MTSQEESNNENRPDAAAFAAKLVEAARVEGYPASSLDWAVVYRHILSLIHPPLSSYPAKTKDQIDEAFKKIEAMGAWGPSIPDEFLTTEALYSDHD